MQIQQNSISIFKASVLISLIALLFVSTYLVIISISDNGKAPFEKPAYVTNVYFSKEVTREKNGFLQPKRIINVLKANNSDNKTLFIANLVLTENGNHDIFANLVDSEGNTIKKMAVKTKSKNNQNDEPFTVIINLNKTILPSGNMFLALYDKHEGSKKPVSLGTFRVLTNG